MPKHKGVAQPKSRESIRPHPSFVTPALHCFLVAARLGSVRSAAEYLNLASSAVSRHIAKLEAAVGATLFERLPRGLRLSNAGELFLYHARESAKQIDRARAVVSDVQGLKRGHVSLATTESVATGLLPPLIAEFWKLYPDITISIIATRSVTAFAGVAKGEYDLAIGFDMPDDLPLRVLASARLIIGAWIPAGHKLEKAEAVDLSDLEANRLLLPEESVRLRSLLNPQLRRAGSIQPRLESNSTSVLEIFTALGCGASIFTKIGNPQVRSSAKIVFRPIKELSRHSQTLQLCARAGGLSPSGSAIANHLLGAIRALSDF
jgi:DNA-binding transcriptional LysR family regulator